MCQECRREKLKIDMKTFFLSSKYSDQWAVLMDKGYHSASECFPSITPQKNPARSVLGKKYEDYNRKLSSDLILVENFFGQLVKLWPILPANFVWSNSLYDNIVALGIKLSNFHIFMHELRDDDGSLYNHYATVCCILVNLRSERDLNHRPIIASSSSKSLVPVEI